jgi:hypothetical protein
VHRAKIVRKYSIAVTTEVNRSVVCDDEESNKTNEKLLFKADVYGTFSVIISLSSLPRPSFSLPCVVIECYPPFLQFILLDLFYF